jgi:hypothetical protein
VCPHVLANPLRLPRDDALTIAPAVFSTQWPSRLSLAFSTRHTSARIGHFLTSRYVVNICLLSSSRGPVSTDAFRRPTQELSSILFRSWTGIEKWMPGIYPSGQLFLVVFTARNCTWVSRVLRPSALQNQSLSTSKRCRLDFEAPRSSFSSLCLASAQQTPCGTEGASATH